MATETQGNTETAESSRSVGVKVLVRCPECEGLYHPAHTFERDQGMCDSCRYACSPCLQCGAKDEYESGEMCKVGSGLCHGSNLFG